MDKNIALISEVFGDGCSGHIYLGLGNVIVFVRESSGMLEFLSKLAAARSTVCLGAVVSVRP